MSRKRPLEFDAYGDNDDIGYEDDEITRHNYVRKKDRKTKGLEVVFDPKAHK